MTRANGAAAPSPSAGPTGTGPPHPHVPRRPLVLALIGLSAVLFLGAAVIIYYHWARMREPNCILVIDFAAPLKGGEVTVDGVVLSQPLRATVGLGENGRYSIPFYLDAGTYTVKVMMGGERQYEHDVRLERDTRATLDLTRLQPTVPTTTPVRGGGGGVGGGTADRRDPPIGHIP